MHLVSQHAPGFPAAAVAAIGQVSWQRGSWGQLSCFQESWLCSLVSINFLMGDGKHQGKRVKHMETLKQLYRAGMGWPPGKRARHQLWGPWPNHETKGRKGRGLVEARPGGFQKSQKLREGSHLVWDMRRCVVFLLCLARV